MRVEQLIPVLLKGTVRFFTVMHRVVTKKAKLQGQLGIVEIFDCSNPGFFCFASPPVEHYRDNHAWY